MSAFMLYHRRSAPTGEVIARALGVSHGVACQPSQRAVDLVRWGAQGDGPNVVNPLVGRVLNKARALALASDKLRTLEVLRAAGVRVPDFSTDPEDLEYPFLGRRRHHARGTDIVLCLQRSDHLRRGRDYYVKYVPVKREFRLHVAGGDVFRVQGKFADDLSLAGVSPWIRNYASGYRFRSPRRRLHSRRLEQAVTAVRALGLDFGAVDMILGDDGESYILEVNTAPACSPLTAAGYVTAFQKMLGIPDDKVRLEYLDILSPDQDDGDTEDPVEGEEDE